MPVHLAPLDKYDEKSRAGVKSLALMLIVFLTIVFRPDFKSDSNLLYAFFATSISVLLSISLNVISVYTGKNILKIERDKFLISAYGSIIAVLLFSIAVLAVGQGSVWFSAPVEYFEDLFGHKYSTRIVTVTIAGFASAGVVILKSIFLDRNRLSISMLFHAIVVILLSCVIVYLISIISKELVDVIS